jgi:hypothetical protein
VRVHLAAEHTLQLELANLRLDVRQITLDFARRRLVILGFGEFQEFYGVCDRAERRVHLFDVVGEPGTLATEFLGFVRLLPDGRVFEFATYFFETLCLEVVLKETPLRS